MRLLDRIFKRKKEPIEIPYEMISEFVKNLDNMEVVRLSADNIQAQVIKPEDIKLTVEQIHKGIDYLKEGS